MARSLNVLDRETLRHLFIDEGLSAKEIAQRYGYARHVGVDYLLRKWEIRKPNPRWRNNHLREIDLSPEQHQVVLGTLLGDGTIHVNSHQAKQGPCLVMLHGELQRDYLEFKKKKLEPFITANEPRHQMLKSDFAADGESGRYSYRSITHHAFQEYRDLLYINGKKMVTWPVMERLGPLGIAIWLMDDGCFAKQSGYINIATNSFTRFEHRIMSDWFLKFMGHAPGIHNAGSRLATQWKLGFNRQASDVLREIVRPHFFEPLLYKLGL